jgi:protein-S-isoprenylcysteine O-methyltransferase Ste14
MNFALPILTIWLIADLVAGWTQNKLVVLLTAVCWLIMDNFWRLKARGTKSAVTITSISIWRKSWLVLRSYGFYYLPLSTVPVIGQRMIPESAVWTWLGLALCMCGVAFAIWSRHVLAKNWTVATGVEEHHALIQSGPYSLVRHPVYFGMLLAMLGTALAVGELRAIINLVISVSEGWTKLNREEAALQKEFPDAYAGYQHRVKKLIPGIF